MLRAGLQRLLEIPQVLPVVDATVADNVDGEQAVLEVGDDFFNDEGLVDRGAHRDRIVSGTQDKIIKQRSADEVALDIIIKRDVALKGHQNSSS